MTNASVPGVQGRKDLANVPNSPPPPNLASGCQHSLYQTHQRQILESTGRYCSESGLIVIAQLNELLGVGRLARRQGYCNKKFKLGSFIKFRQPNRLVALTVFFWFLTVTQVVTVRVMTRVRPA